MVERLTDHRRILRSTYLDLITPARARRASLLPNQPYKNSTELEIKYQLATTKEIAHVVVTPSVTRGTLDVFIDEYTTEHATK